MGKDKKNDEEYEKWLNCVRAAHSKLPSVANVDTKVSERIDTDLLWKEFELHLDLVKHYLDLVIKFNLFYYVATGGLLSYYFLHVKDVPQVKWSLAYLLLMSFIFGALFIGASVAIPQVDKQIENICRLMGFAKPEILVLKYAMVASGSLFIVTGSVLVVILLVNVSG